MTADLSTETHFTARHEHVPKDTLVILGVKSRSRTMPNFCKDGLQSVPRSVPSTNVLEMPIIHPQMSIEPCHAYECALRLHLFTATMLFA